MLLSHLSRTVARKSSIGGLYVCAGALDILKIDKTPLIYSVSYFNLGRLGAPFGVISPPTPHPVARVMQVRHH